jgi:tetratricopeptide (TPR) repeat protein
MPTGTPSLPPAVARTRNVFPALLRRACLRLAPLLAALALAGPLSAQNTATALVASGVAKSRVGDFDGALADYSRAIQQDGKNAPAYGNRGVAKQDKGDLAGAIADYTVLIGLDAQNPSSFLIRGYARQSNGEFEGAADDYGRCVELAPERASYARFYLSLTLRRLKRDEAPAGLAFSREICRKRTFLKRLPRATS